MNAKIEDLKMKLRALRAHGRQIVLGALLILFLVLSVIAMWRGQEAATIGFLVASGAMLLFIFPGMVESVRFGNVEMKLRQAEEVAAEAREVAKLVAEIAIPLAHYSEGWAETAPSTAQKKDAVLGRVHRMKDILGVEIADDILEMDYVKTCSDYNGFIIVSLSETDRSAFRRELGTTMIPTRIEDVPTPQRLEEILKKLGYWDDYMETLVEDFRHYYKNRTHRNEERWKERTEWKRTAEETG